MGYLTGKTFTYSGKFEKDKFHGDGTKTIYKN
jgi:hypothetical protein